MSKKNNRINVPEAREAMDKFKMEAASEVGVNLKEGYNGDLSSREAGSVGGQMVKKMTPMRSMRSDGGGASGHGYISDRFNSLKNFEELPTAMGSSFLLLKWHCSVSLLWTSWFLRYR